MFWNFIKGTFRNFAGHKSFTAINILGLSVGITCALIISLYVIHETSYDKIHSNHENIYRITLHGQVNDIKFNSATSSGALSKVIPKEINEISEFTSVARLGGWLVTNDSIRYNENNILFVNSDFLNFFDGFEVIGGDKSKMFTKPRSIVLTKSAAIKYFNTTNILGEKLLLETGDRYYTVTGIIEDVPSNSHIQFDMLASLVTYQKSMMRWTTNNVYNYVKINNASDVQTVTKKLNEFVNKYILVELNHLFENAFQDSDEYRFELQPVASIHLHSALEAELEPNGKAVYVYTFGIVAILILIIACLNFMNLSSANSINRAQEVVLRKVAGAEKRLLVLQFLVESVIYSLVALVIALLLTEIFLPLFNKYLELHLEFHFFTNITAVFGILIFAVFVGIIAGSYPALFISSFDPVKVLHGQLGQGVKNKKVRAIFVVLQFFISVLIIILTIVIYSQVRFMMKKDLGFEKDHVIVIQRSDALKKNMKAFKQEILSNANVESATNSNTIPGRGFYNSTFRLLNQKESTTHLLNQVYVNYDYCEAYNLELTQGRFFDPKEPMDSFACVINESAAELMGLSYPVGAKLEHPGMFKKYHENYTIIGVVKNFHFQSVDKPIQPLVICFMPGNWEGFINVKLNPKYRKKTLAHIESVWNKYAPDYPFVYFNLNDDFNKGYNSQIKLVRIFIIFSTLAIFVACLGLFGLVAFITNQRVREIGIRKALGASALSLVYMLTKETLKLVVIASLLACTAGFLLSRYWLNGFHYHIKLSPKYFITASLLVIILAISTVFVQAFKAARKEPGISLKYE